MLNLEKGAVLNLSKVESDLSKITMGLGWEGIGGRNLDLDSYVAILDNQGNTLDLVYFSNLRSKGIQHKGDDLVGGGRKDMPNEEIVVTLDALNANATKLVFGLFIYAGASNLSKVDYSFVTMKDKNNNEILRYNINDNFGGYKSLTVCEMTKEGNEWIFKAVGKGEQLSYTQVKKKYTKGSSSNSRGGFFSRLFN